MKKVHAPLKKAKQTSRWYLFKCLSYWVPTIWHLIKKALRLTLSVMYAGWYHVQKNLHLPKNKTNAWCMICFAGFASWRPLLCRYHGCHPIQDSACQLGQAMLFQPKRTCGGACKWSESPRCQKDWQADWANASS